jgi:endonuclease/exonuclease/phosphatase family metal-dependent hydrolase
VTNDTQNLLIDHILVSRQVQVEDVTIWKPYLDHEPANKDQAVTAIRDALKEASGHYPASARVDLR